MLEWPLFRRGKITQRDISDGRSKISITEHVASKKDSDNLDMLCIELFLETRDLLLGRYSIISKNRSYEFNIKHDDQKHVRSTWCLSHPSAACCRGANEKILRST